MITIRELAGMPHLGLRFLAGRPGDHRRVAWGHVCELADPTPWLEGRELILTNGMAVPRRGEGQRSYVATLDEHGVSGLMVARGVAAPPLRREMLDEADRRCFPILEVPLEVPFAAIAKAIADANHSEAEQRLLTHLRIFDTLRTATGGRPGLPRILAGLRQASGFDLFLLSAAGTALRRDLPEPPPSLLARFPRNPDMPPVIPGGCIVAVPTAGRGGYLAAVGAPDGPAPDVVAAQHIATVVALALTNARREQEMARRIGAEVLSELMSEEIQGSRASAWLRTIGFQDGADVVLLAIQAPIVDGSELVHRALAELDIPHLLLTQRVLYCLAPATVGAGEVISRLDTEIRAGVSRPFHVREGLAQPCREARWALARAAGTARGLVVAASPEDELFAWLPTDAGDLGHLARTFLGPVLDYDARHATQMLRSLQVWLEHDRSTAAASRTLHVHKHTLEYRLKRVAELTGRNPSRTPDLVGFWLALRAREMAEHPARTAGPPASQE